MKTIKSIKTSRKSTRIRTALVAATLLGGSLLAVAAQEDTAATPSNAASNAGATVSDSWITTKVKSELLANSVSKGFQVSVTTRQGVVALEGKLPSKEAIDYVKSLSEKVAGVKSVDTSGLVVGG